MLTVDILPSKDIKKASISIYVLSKILLNFLDITSHHLYCFMHGCLVLGLSSLVLSPLSFQIKNDTVISIWKGGSGMAKELAAVTAAGYKVVLSACWYLNYISYGDDWEKVSSGVL